MTDKSRTCIVKNDVNIYIYIYTIPLKMEVYLS